MAAASSARSWSSPASWIAAGRRVMLVIGSTEGPLKAEIPAGIELIELGSDRYPALLALPRHVRAVKPDVIFCPGNHYTGIAAVTKLRLGRHCPPIVAKISNAFARADQGAAAAWGYRLWLRRHPAFIDHFVAMAPAMREEAIRVARLDPASVDVVPDPLPQAAPSGAGAAAAGRALPPRRRPAQSAETLGSADRQHRPPARAAPRHPRRGPRARHARGAGRAARHRGPRSPCRACRAIRLPPWRGAGGGADLGFRGRPRRAARGAVRSERRSSRPIRRIDPRHRRPASGQRRADRRRRALVAALDHWLAPARPRPDARSASRATMRAQRYLDGVRLGRSARP